MPFPDFLRFKPFNYLREQMGASELGDFEFFDPKSHLSAEERQQLREGLELDAGQIVKLPDHTVAYKNGRVLLSLVDPTKLSDWSFHLAACEQMQSLKGKVRASSCRPQHPSGQFVVCGDCLQVLRYKGFDVVRNRHRHYSQRLHDEFNLEDFFEHYPAYPLSKEFFDCQQTVV